MKKLAIIVGMLSVTAFANNDPVTIKENSDGNKQVVQVCNAAPVKTCEKPKVIYKTKTVVKKVPVVKYKTVTKTVVKKVPVVKYKVKKQIVKKRYVRPEYSKNRVSVLAGYGALGTLTHQKDANGNSVITSDQGLVMGLQYGRDIYNSRSVGVHLLIQGQTNKTFSGGLGLSF